MEFESRVALESRGDLLRERAVAVEPRDLIFVLHRHQLEEIARDRLGEARLARHFRFFRRVNFGDALPR